MKALKILSILVISVLSNVVVSQNDTMYVIQSGVVIGKHAVSNVDSLVFYDVTQIDSFSTNDNIKDEDGNIYNLVTIGEQEWMAENLRTSKYEDGTTIPNITDDSQWKTLTTGSWGNYENNSQNDSAYGKLYNWYAVHDPRNICPTGWHVPTDAEWTTLTDYLIANGHSGAEVSVLKANFGWNYYKGQNGNGTDVFGWAGLPGGYRSSSGKFYNIGERGHWWSSSQYISEAWYRGLISDDLGVDKSRYNKRGGFSVRCIKD
jgi:uncharacterized protein (TIGR02145 family)